VVVLRDDDMSERSCPGPSGDCAIWRRSRRHRVAGPAGQFLANVPDDPRLRGSRLLNPAWHVIAHLRHLIADLAQRAAATGTGARCSTSQILSGQVFPQWAPRRLLRFGLDYRGDGRRCLRQPFRLVALQRLCVSATIWLLQRLEYCRRFVGPGCLVSTKAASGHLFRLIEVDPERETAGAPC